MSASSPNRSAPAEREESAPSPTLTVAGEPDLPDPDQHPRLRAETLDQLFRLGGERLVGQLVDLFAGSARERVDAMRTGAKPGQAEEAERAAHTLKSSAGNLGAMRMWALCQCIESAAAAGQFDSRYFELVEELGREHAIVEPRLRRFLEESR